MDNYWWVLVLVGVSLLIAEVFVPEFIIMWLGIAAIVTAIPVYFGASLNVILFTYVLTLLLLVTFIQRISIRLFGRGVPMGSVVGSMGIVIEEIDTVRGTGQVRVGKEEWSATCLVDLVIPLDEVVTVVGVSGVKLVVKRRSE